MEYAFARLDMKALRATRQLSLSSVARTTAQTTVHAPMESVHAWLTPMAMLCTKAMIARRRPAPRVVVSMVNAPREHVYAKLAGREKCATLRCAKRV
jgi:hypothetical protein